MIDPFIPAPSQQQRLSDAEYEAISGVTLAKLTELENSTTLPSPDNVDDYAAELIAQLQRDMSPSTEALLSGQYAIADWEKDIARIVVSAILLGLLAAVGGVAGLQSQQDPVGFLQFAKSSIEIELAAVKANAAKVAAGTMTAGQILGSIKRRSLSFRASFERSMHSALIASGTANEGRRLLTSPHPCPNCPDYERTDWVPLTDIVPIASMCVCQSFCKCRIYTRFNPQRALQEIGNGQFANRVERARDFQARTEAEWRATWS